MIFLLQVHLLEDHDQMRAIVQVVLVLQDKCSATVHVQWPSRADQAFPQQRTGS